MTGMARQRTKPTLISMMPITMPFTTLLYNYSMTNMRNHTQEVKQSNRSTSQMMIRHQGIARITQVGKYHVFKSTFYPIIRRALSK
ncbi:hypothetical protein DPMN_043812 [Dreissena polymorpha]|uniref:Uncharacterized protein n=1 Tax=Dreissena polymorpha TaxID=45954 RepID=A0A9D4HVY7_DREPO|nr:hypothetical protein DPMN_043812 [Dreissena polymorpha]